MLKVALIFFVALVTVIPGYLFVLGRISKQGAAPGIEAGKLAPCPDKPNCVSSDATDPAHEIEPLAFETAPAAAWEKVQEIVNSLPGTRIVEATDTYLSAECESRIFGFVDDLELHLRSEDSVIAVRSASRVGHSDFSANRKRVENLRSEFLKDRQAAQ